MKIVLISCVSKKGNEEAEAKNLYLSPLFRYNLKYASFFNPDKIFVLSAKYGLLNLEDKVKPYEKSLNKMRSREVKEWSKKVLRELKEISNLEKDEFIFLAGERYRKFLIPSIKNYKIPLEGLGIGKQLKFLKEATNE